MRVAGAEVRTIRLKHRKERGCGKMEARFYSMWHRKSLRWGRLMQSSRVSRYLFQVLLADSTAQRNQVAVVFMRLACDCLRSKPISNRFELITDLAFNQRFRVNVVMNKEFNGPGQPRNSVHRYDIVFACGGSSKEEHRLIFTGAPAEAHGRPEGGIAVKPT